MLKPKYRIYHDSSWWPQVKHLFFWNSLVYDISFLGNDISFDIQEEAEDYFKMLGINDYKIVERR